MQYYHLCCDDAGQSHWQPDFVQFRAQGTATPDQTVFASESIPAKTMLFLRLTAGWHEAIQPSPSARLIVALMGRVLVTADDGVNREIGPGDVWRIDMHSGHQIHVISDIDFEALVVQFA